MRHLMTPLDLSVEELDVLTRKVQSKVYKETGVVLTGVGVYSYNTSDDEAAHIRNAVQEKVLTHPWALQLHGFYVDLEEKNMRFDVVLSFDSDHGECLKILQKELQSAYPDYHILIVGDVDVSD